MMDGAEFKGNDSPQMIWVKFGNRGEEHNKIKKEIFTLWVLEVEVHDTLTPSVTTKLH